MHNYKTAFRLALFVIYFWFGALKVLSLSPASQLVLDLLDRTLPFIESHLFLICFGVFEMIIGLLFLIPSAYKLSLALFTIHMITAFMPLFLLPAVTWQSIPFVPTLEGQYIIKNVALIALVLGL